jgi:hypothetical protein
MQTDGAYRALAGLRVVVGGGELGRFGKLEGAVRRSISDLRLRR